LTKQDQNLNKDFRLKIIKLSKYITDFKTIVEKNFRQQINKYREIDFCFLDNNRIEKSLLY